MVRLRKTYIFALGKYSSIKMKKASDKIKQMLINKLKEEHKLWSYDQESVKDLPNEILIEKVLVYLDLEEIDLLFSIFSARTIKEVWINRMIPQGEYLYTLNRFLSWYYFKIKKPDAYLKGMMTRFYNKVA